MMVADEEHASSASSEQWRDSNEQSRGLLDEKRVFREKPSWAVRWWQFALLFVVSVSLLVPFAVNLAPKGSSWKEVISKPEPVPDLVTQPVPQPTPESEIESPAIEEPESVLPKDEYLLDPNWDFHAAATVREYTWTLTETEFNPDGVFRPMLLINNQFPGPLIEANEHDTIRVTVRNQMTNATSIHWHGLYQNGTNAMDGTVGITQCPIAANGTFIYEFKVENQSGSYWYHAHQGVQASDGLVGPLVIHSKEERQRQQIRYTSDRIIMVSDHYHDLSGALARRYLAPDMENAEPVPDGALINGRAIRNCDELPHRKCDNSSVGIPTFDLAPNHNHRLRIINTGAFAEIQLQLDEHQLAVTEVDGTDVWPVSFHRLNINPAQRYSVVINTNVSGSTSFRMRARMVTKCFAEENPYMAGEVQGVVRYNEAPNPIMATEFPDTIDWGEALALECRDLDTSKLFPVEKIAAPAKPDAMFYLRSNFEIGAYRLSRGYFNGSSWRSDVHHPTLLRAVDGLESENASFTQGDKATVFVNDEAFHQPTELVVQSTGIQTIDILISNFDDGNHPMHLHGYKYFVLAQGHGYPPRKSLDAPMDLENLQPLYDSLDLSNPLRRDTASVEAFGWALLRFVADNPGSWAFHCHISWHTEAGLLMQFLTRTDMLAETGITDAHRTLCAADGLEKGMGPTDEIYYDEA